MKAFYLVASISVLALGVSACGGSGPDCGSYCKDVAAACNLSSLEQLCVGNCNTDNNAANAAGCSSKMSDVLSCGDSHKSDMCVGTSNVCSAESTALSTCITTYCSANPSNSACTAYGSARQQQ